MGKLIRFKNGRSGCWSRVKLESGELVWISVTQAGVIVKKSHTFLLGEKLYEKSGADEAILTAVLLYARIETYGASVGLSDPVLKVFTQIALDSASTLDLKMQLTRATKPTETTEAVSDRDRRNELKYQQIIADYGRFIADNPPRGEIRNVSELPHSMDEILEAITFQIVREKKPAELKALKLGALMLADFQEEGSLNPAKSIGFDGFDFVSGISNEEQDLIKRSTKIAYNNGRQRLKSVKELADQNLLQIENKLVVAEALRHKLMQAG